MPQLDAYSALIQRLDQFIRKYYLNQMIRGTLYTLALVGLAFLAINLLEGNFYFERTGRKALFYGFVGLSVLSAGIWILLPAAHYFRLGSVISHEKAASIIGNHFGNVQDKLLNLLQLGERAQTEESDLLLAGIEQKSSELQPVPFRKAIDLGENKKYLRYALPPMLLLLVLLIAAPTLITDSTSRIVRNNEDFERPAPFTFVLPEGDLSVVQFEDFPLTVQAEGPLVPAEAYISIDGNSYRMRPEGGGRFSYNFQNVAEDLDFNFISGDVSSLEHTLGVVKKPNLLGFSVQLDYPGYTGRRDETLDNLGDLTIPQGTRIRWTFEADQTDEVELRFGESLDTASREGRQIFLYNRRANRSMPYTVISGNEALPRADSVRYGITVIPDRNPRISAETFRDSSQRNVLFFAGEASDDYGLSALRFVYTRTNAKGATSTEQVDLGKPSGKTSTFEYTFDMLELALKPGEEISYYFETLDNDGVNGSKSARTPVESFRKKTLDEYEEAREEQSDDIKKKLKESAKESKEIQEKMKQLREKLLQEKEVDWQAKQELQKLLEKQKALQEKIDQAKQEFDKQLEEQEEFQQPDEEIQEKQEKLEEMFEELQDPEMQELMEKIQELMEKLEKDDALDMMEEMESNEDEQEQKLDRLEELFKKLELEYDMQEAAKKLEELAEKQEELAEESKEKKDGEQNEEQKEKQEELNEEFEKLTEKLEDIEKKNEELEKPGETGIDKEEQEEVKKDQEEAGEQMEQQQNQQAGKKQQDAADKMKKMAGDMKAAAGGAQQEQMKEDIKALRQLLENLVAISFDQEDLLGSFGKTEVNTPRYVEEVQRQFKLKDDFRIVEDSLQALAKRIFQIESFVLEKVGDINVQLDRGLKNLEDRKTNDAANNQQRIMTDVNDLALMLSESMEQMQQQMAQSMPGSQSCEKPGGKKGKGKGKGQSGNVPSDKQSEGQQDLKEQMERALENMKKRAEGQKQGKGEKGEKGGPGGEGGSSKEFAEMAQRQAELRKQLMDKQRKLQEQGKGSQELQGIIDEMNKMEEDLVNKRLTNQMIKRQEQILTKLLEAEKAERQQDEDEKRKSETAQRIERSLPPQLEEYLKQRAAQTDLYREVSPELRPYYRQLVEQYFEELKGK